MGLRFKTLWQYEGLFAKCYAEPCTQGWSVFDRKHNFVGMIFDDAFALNADYKHHDAVARELARKGITIVDYDTHQEIELEVSVSEALYSEPK